MKKFISVLLIAVLLLSAFSSINTQAASSLNGKIAARIETSKESLEASIIDGKGNDRYSYSGYKGIKLSEKGQKCADMSAMIGLMPDEVSDYFAEPLTRKDLALLLMRSLGNLTLQPIKEMAKAYGSKKMSDCSSLDAGVCLSLGLMKNTNGNAFSPEKKVSGEEAAEAFWNLAVLTGGVKETGNEGTGFKKLKGLKDPYLNTYVISDSEKSLYDESYFSREAGIIVNVRVFDAIVGAYMKKGGESMPTPTQTPTPTLTPTVTPIHEVPTIAPTVTPTPVLTERTEPTPTPQPIVGKEAGKRIIGDKKPQIDLRKKLRDDPDFLMRTYGSVSKEKNPDLTKEILQKIMDGEMGFEMSVMSNGKMKEIAKYWGTRSQLEKYVTAMFKGSGIKSTKRDFATTVSFFNSGNDLGRTMMATCGKPLVLGKKNMLAFRNEESEKRKILNTMLYTWIPNYGQTFKLDSGLTLKNLDERTKNLNRFMIIDPNKRLVGCYFKEKIDAVTGQSEGCWILKADADSTGKYLYLDGYLTVAHSSGVRNVFETHYVVEVK